MAKQGTIGERKWRKWNRGVLYRNRYCRDGVLITVVLMKDERDDTRSQ